MNRPLPAVLALALASALWPACGEPTPLPTAEAVAEMALPEPPPLYQALYEVPTLDAARPEQQRVRLLIWLRHMDLSIAQLDALAELRALAVERHDRVLAAQEAAADDLAADEQAVYDALWTELNAGTALDDARMDALSAELVAARTGQDGQDRRTALLTLHLDGVRAIIEAEREFLRTLSPIQEALLADAVFLLRHRLDPIAEPGDFRALVGSTYDAGEFGVLTRGGGSDWADAPLNIGGLWADEAPLEGGALYDARREVLLFLALLEPGLDQAIAAARAQIAGSGAP